MDFAIREIVDYIAILTGSPKLPQTSSQPASSSAVSALMELLFDRDVEALDLPTKLSKSIP